MSFVDISKIIHLSSPAVKKRINLLQKNNIITAFTISVNIPKEIEMTAFITLFMKTSAHIQMRQYLKKTCQIKEAHRISGSGCYWIRACYKKPEDLLKILNDLSVYGTYQTSISIEQIIN